MKLLKKQHTKQNKKKERRSPSNTQPKQYRKQTLTTTEGYMNMNWHTNKNSSSGMKDKEHRTKELTHQE